MTDVVEPDAVDSEATPRRLRRRIRAAGRRRRTGVCFSEDEFTAIVTAATGAGMTPAGFCAEASLAVARQQASAPRVDREALRQIGLELLAARTAVNRLGRDVRQATMAVDPTGPGPGDTHAGPDLGETHAVLEACRRAVARLDVVVATLARRVR